MMEIVELVAADREIRDLGNGKLRRRLFLRRLGLPMFSVSPTNSESTTRDV